MDRKSKILGFFYLFSLVIIFVRMVGGELPYKLEVYCNILFEK